jgi:tRNA-dihydrouridine synthase
MLLRLFGSFALVLIMSSRRAFSTAKTGFFESIGKPRFISAPMVEHSYLPWRLLVRKNGADLAFTQMMHAKNYNRVKVYRKSCSDWLNYDHRSGDPSQKEEVQRLEKNIIAQLAGDDVESLVQAGKHMHHDVAAIDLNLGCPQMIAKRGHYGAYLLKERELVITLLSAMVKELDCPITAKIRILPNDKDTLDLCRAIEDCGVSMLTVHGREIISNKTLIGAANWDIIRQVKQTVKIPVIANGGISSYTDALRCLEYTGADGIMSAEALLENPKLFSEGGDRLFRTDFARAQIQTAKEYLELVEGYTQDVNLSVVRGHLFKMLNRFLTAPGQKDMQLQMLARDYAGLKGVVDTLEQRLAAVGYCMQAAQEAGLVTSSGYYLRHRRDAPPQGEQAVVTAQSEPRVKTSTVCVM